MWLKHFSLLVVLLLVCQNQSFAQRYVVKDDSFGNTDAAALSSLDEEERIELEQKQAEAKSNESIPSNIEAEQAAVEEVDVESASENRTQDQTQQTEEATALTPTPAPAPSLEPTSIENESAVSSLEQADTTDPSGTSENLSVNTSESTLSSQPAVPRSELDKDEKDLERESDDPFLREYKRTEAQETDEVIKRLRERAQGSEFDATIVDPADFVDSEDLLKGNVDSQGEQPFYITINSEGEHDVIFYSPKVIQDEIDRLKFEEQVSDAVVFFPSDNEQASIVLPEGADPKALAILSGGQKKSYFSRFVERCCEGLPNVGILKLKTEQSAYADFKREDFSYRFTDGDSRYSLIRLPDLRRKYLVTIKTFVKSYKRRGIDSGAFIPQVVILDRDKRVKRIISNMESRSYAETWTSYGYLKSVVEIDQTSVDADAFILLYTTADSLRRSTIVEDTSSQWEIRHMETGSVEVAVAESSL